ncbi:glycoside hydrolase family 25 protein [Novosphingobium sp. 9]|uniref:glycoside hydrolase family 25 protein n=1 Tax=Novosphingobium sp. 9 TaxID=2025349 RepID=UPI0021B5E980|nr:GH25 family lysozyme [Novosphingobium sp. 9]
MARKKRRVGQARLILIVVIVLALLAAVGSGIAWWHLRHWTPPHDAYPMQGVEVSDADGDIAWDSLKAIGVKFAYIDASASAFARDPRFVANLEHARAAGLQVGAVHLYDPCQPAQNQAANFVVTVPRDLTMLPPAVELDRLADDCPVHVSEAKVESELMTFLNQIETHTGKPVILKVTPRFQSRYDISAKLDRNLWLVRDRVQPDYAGRPWTMWTANSDYLNEVTEHGLRWVVVQP